MKRVFRISRDWFFLILYVVIIFFILPFSKDFFETLSGIIGTFPVLISFFVYGALAAASIGLITYVVLAKKQFKVPRLLVLVAILCAGAYGFKEIDDPYDRLHIIEYGVLSFSLFRILRFYNPTTALYLWCIIFTLIAGFTDEFVQVFIPGRNPSLRDVAIDLYTAVLSQLTIALVICPKLEKWRVRISFLKKNLYRRDEWIKGYKKSRA